MAGIGISIDTDGLQTETSHRGLARDTNGDIFCVYKDTSDSRIYIKKSTDDGATWGSKVSVKSTGTTINFPVIAIDSNDNIFVVATGVTVSQPTKTQLLSFKSTDGGASFGSQVEISNTAHDYTNPNLIIDDNDDLYVVSMRDNNTPGIDDVVVFCKSTNGGTSYTVPAIIAQSVGLNNWLPKIVCNDDVTPILYCTYMKQESGPNRWNFVSIKSTDGGTVWGSEVYITNDTNTKTFVTNLVIDTYGVLHTCYLTTAGGNPGRNCFYANSLDEGGTWETPIEVSNTSQTPGTIGIGITREHIYVVWEEVVPALANFRQLFSAHSEDIGLNFDSPVQHSTDNTRHYQVDSLLFANFPKVSGYHIGNPQTGFMVLLERSIILGTPDDLLSFGYDLSFSQIPNVTTNAASLIADVSAQGNGNIDQTGESPVTSRGFQYGLTKTPTWSVSEDAPSWQVGAYDKRMINLTANTIYYYRAFATSILGTGVGEWVQFTTIDPFSTSSSKLDVSFQINPSPNKAVGTNDTTTDFIDLSDYLTSVKIHERFNTATVATFNLMNAAGLIVSKLTPNAELILRIGVNNITDHYQFWGYIAPNPDFFNKIAIKDKRFVWEETRSIENFGVSMTAIGPASDQKQDVQEMDSGEQQDMYKAQRFSMLHNNPFFPSKNDEDDISITAYDFIGKLKMEMVRYDKISNHNNRPAYAVAESIVRSLTDSPLAFAGASPDPNRRVGDTETDWIDKKEFIDKFIMPVLTSEDNLPKETQDYYYKQYNPGTPTFGIFKKPSVNQIRYVGKRLTDNEIMNYTKMKGGGVKVDLMEGLYLGLGDPIYIDTDTGGYRGHYIIPERIINLTKDRYNIQLILQEPIIIG